MSLNMLDPQTLNLVRLDGGGGGQYTFDDTPTNGSRNPVTSDGIYDAMVNQRSAIETDVAATYETKTNAANTYETKTNAASTYETKTNAASTYETKTNAASTYETKANAASTYETKSHAAETYATDADLQEAISNIQSVTTAQADADFSDVFGNVDPPTNVLLGNVSSFDSSDVEYESD